MSETTTMVCARCGTVRTEQSMFHQAACLSEWVPASTPTPPAPGAPTPSKKIVVLDTGAALPPEIVTALDEYAAALHHDQYALMGPTKRHAARAALTAAILRALVAATERAERYRDAFERIEMILDHSSHDGDIRGPSMLEQARALASDHAEVRADVRAARAVEGREHGGPKP